MTKNSENEPGGTGSASNILIYQPEDGKTRIDVRLEDETVWLTQGQLGFVSDDQAEHQHPYS